MDDDPNRAHARTLAEAMRGRIGGDTTWNAPKELAQLAIETAIVFARTSPCRKSRRGCAIFNPAAAGVAGLIIGAGFNGQVPPWRCDGTCNRKLEDGRSVCGLTAEHAEYRAIISAIDCLALSNRWSTEQRLGGMELVHIKVNENGVPVPSGGPSCIDCSRHVVSSRLEAVWLFQHGTVTDANGIGRHTPASWVRWPALDFHAETMRACGLTADLSRAVVPT